MVSRRGVIAGALIAPAVLKESVAVAAGPASTPPSLEELYRPPELLDTALSPDGKRLAVLRELRQGAGKGSRTSYVQLLLTDDLTAAPKIVTIGDHNVEQVEWANDERLLIWLRLDKTADGKPTGLYFDGVLYPVPVRRVLAVGVDGGNPVVLFHNQPNTSRKLFNLSVVVDTLADDPRRILMQRWDRGRDAFGLFHVDVYSGEATLLEFGEHATDGWLTQNGVPVLRYDSNSRGTTVSIYARSPGAPRWVLIKKARRDELKRLVGLDIVGVTPEAGTLLISHRADNENFAAIRKFDLRTFQVGDVVVQPGNHELDGVFTDERHNLIAVRQLDDRLGYTFVDPALPAHYKSLGAYFENDCNVVLYDVDATHKRFLLHASGPRNAGAFVSYDTVTRKLDHLGDQRPWLSADRLARVETLKVRSRDGVDIPAYLTIPIAPGPRPMVVMPHGGPEVRDKREFDTWAQALAARGWLVLQPNFRGSGGYGRAYADAGRRRWGDRMQEDVEDCVASLVASGRADPQRIAIFGASYGGYAALMGAFRRPILYRCAVSVAGPSDLMKFLAYVRRDDGADFPVLEYWSKTIGDPEGDRAMIEAASPALQAQAVNVPVLLIHGDEDGIVPVEQSRIMDKALTKAGKPHEYVELKGVGHRGWERDTEMDVLNRTINFIAKAFA